MDILKKTLGPIMGMALVLVLFQGCQDSPTGMDDTADIFPSEKISLEGESYPEVEFYAAQEGLDMQEILTPSDRKDGVRDGDKGNGSGAEDGDRPSARPDPAQLFRRILGTLDLNERQKNAIAGCFEEYRECIASATRRARAVRSELHAELVSKIRRIRNAVAEGSITRVEARRLALRAIRDYRESAVRLAKAYRAAKVQCARDLKDCIEGYLTDRQIRKFNYLLKKATGGDDGDRDGDKKDKDKEKDKKDGRIGTGG